jgi:hypothetical protein
MQYPRTLEAIRVDRPAPPHVPKDRIVDLTFAMGQIPNDLVDPYLPARRRPGQLGRHPL